MNKYKTLLKNTLVFASGTLGSKILVFLMMPFYTRMLNTDQYGLADLLVNTANLILPIITLSIADAIVRFSLDHAVNKKDVFSGGLFTVLCGFIVFLLFLPLMHQFKTVSDYLFLIYFYVFCSSINSVCGQFVRSTVSTKLYAWSGFQNTIIVIVLNILFLLVFHFGINGYILSIAFADLLTAGFLFIRAKLHQYLDIKHINKSVLRGMMLFSIPLIPNAIGWWITSVSDRYIITYMFGKPNGLYAAAYKLPTFVALISTIFTQAWQLSAITEFDEEGKTIFYRKVFSMYETVVFLAAAFLVVLCRPLNMLLVAPDYYDSWIFIPFLILAFVFQCFSGFWASIYMAAKRNLSVMLTTLMGAGINVILNFIFIPIFGPIGAAFATFISYFMVFVGRAVDSRRFIHIHINIRKITVNFSIVLTMCLILICQPHFFVLYEIILLALIVFLNSLIIKSTVTNLLHNFKAKRA